MIEELEKRIERIEDYLYFLSSVLNDDYIPKITIVFDKDENSYSDKEFVGDE